MKKEQSNVDSLEPNVDSSRSNVASLESKFKVGDKVRITGSGTEAGKAKIGEVGEVLDIDTQNNACFVLYRKGQDWVRVCDLEPYIEESRNLSQDIANCDKSEDNKLKDNMEEKKLNLCELLKGYEGEKIYLPDEGECEIVSVAENEIELSQEPNRKIILSEDSYIFTRTGFAYAYPSKESFLANPLNACKAWQGWKEARKPKRWRAEYGETYYSLRDSFTVCDQYENNDSDNDCAWNNYNYFRTEEEAKQAAEEVKECLMKFHEKNAGRDI